MWLVRTAKQVKKGKLSKTLKVELKINSLLKSESYKHRFIRKIMIFSCEVYLKINFQHSQTSQENNLTRVAS
jgi:hypothetical protein